MTAYRQQALACAASLAGGPRRTSEIRSAIPNAPSILLRNVYGWFTRIKRGVYTLTPEGASGLIMTWVGQTRRSALKRAWLEQPTSSKQGKHPVIVSSTIKGPSWLGDLRPCPPTEISAMTTVYDFTAQDITGATIPLGTYQGKVLLIVRVHTFRKSTLSAINRPSLVSAPNPLPSAQLDCNRHVMGRVARPGLARRIECGQDDAAGITRSGACSRTCALW